MASLQQRAESLLTKHLPALAALLSVSDPCRKCVLELAIREYHDAEGGAGEMENVFEGSSVRGGRRSRLRRHNESLRVERPVLAS